MYFINPSNTDVNIEHENLIDCVLSKYKLLPDQIQLLTCMQLRYTEKVQFLENPKTSGLKF